MIQEKQLIDLELQRKSEKCAKNKFCSPSLMTNRYIIPSLCMLIRCVDYTKIIKMNGVLYIGPIEG